MRASSLIKFLIVVALAVVGAAVPCRGRFAVGMVTGALIVAFRLGEPRS